VRSYGIYTWCILPYSCWNCAVKFCTSGKKRVIAEVLMSHD
jgi:hypothetical protein